MEDEIPISKLHLEWFQKRKISLKTLLLGKVYSVERYEGGEHQISLEGKILAFPFIHDGKVVNIKYRAPGKRFYQSGGEKVFWNADAINDVDVQSGANPLVICEGEIDGLSFIEAEYPFVVSCPNGAPPTVSSRNINPDDDKAFSYIVKAWNELENVKSIIIATDNDDPGRCLAEELVRRLGRDRCKFVTYPEGCKDANDVLGKHGPKAVMQLLTQSKPYPVSGLYTLDDLPKEPDLDPKSIGWDDRLNLKAYYPAFMAVTGKANHGKSLWCNQLVANLAYMHGWPAAIASYEMRIRPFITRTLEGTYHSLGGSDPVDQWINQNFVFIAPNPNADTDNFDVEWLIARATTAVIRHGIRVLLVDPWNEIDHATKRNENNNDYTGRAIRLLKRFGQEHEVLVIVVAHPNKWAITNKTPENIDLYDISDTSHFANKADLGVTIYRIDGSNEGGAVVTKVRDQPDTGKNYSRMMLTYDSMRRIFV